MWLHQSDCVLFCDNEVRSEVGGPRVCDRGMIAIPGLVVYYTMSSRRPSKAKHSGESQRRINSSATLEERKCLSVLAMEEHCKGNSVTANTLDVEDHKHRSAPLQRRAGSASASCLSRTPLSKRRV